MLLFCCLLLSAFLGLLPGDASALALSSCSSSNESFQKRRQSRADSSTSRRGVLVAVAFATVAPLAQPVNAAADCYTDCFKNCKAIVPKDVTYCQTSCTDYCDQDDRQDGLSGSVGSAAGEVGILGGTFGMGTVPKGQDKPPEIRIPGLDFNSESGKKLLGY